MALQCDDRSYLASNLTFEISFYQDGITRFLIGEQGNSRFRISQEDLPVVWDQLELATDTLTMKTTKSDSSYEISGLSSDGDEFWWGLDFKPFKLTQKVNGVIT